MGQSHDAREGRFCASGAVLFGGHEKARYWAGKVGHELGCRAGSGATWPSWAERVAQIQAQGAKKPALGGLVVLRAWSG